MASKKTKTTPASVVAENKTIFNLAILTMLLIAAYYLLVGPRGFFPYQVNVEKRPEVQTDANVTEVIFAIDEQNDSGEKGFVTFTQWNGAVRVDLALQGAPTGLVQPAHIHKGTCAKLGDIVMPLLSSLDGQSTTELTTSMDKLSVQLPLAVNVHMSDADMKTSVACVDLSF
jgi:hypothetical protein